MRKRVFLLVAVLVFSLVFPSNLSIGHAMEKADTNELDISSSYYFIYYNGEKQEINLNEEVVLHLNGWTNEKQEAVEGYLTDSLGDHEVFSMNVGEEREQLPLSEEESILYRIVPSDSYKIEQVEPVTFTDQVTVIAQNDNGTSIEEVKTLDEYGTVVHNQGLTYYSIDENQQKALITKEEYDSLNFVTDPSSSEKVEEPSTPSEEVPEETQDDEIVQPENNQDASLENEETSKSTTTEESPSVMPKAKASRAMIQSAVLNPSINYASFVDGKWQSPVKDGVLSGTSGQSKQLEAMKIYLANANYAGSVTYKTHVQGYGWMTSKTDGAESGAPGEGKRMEAVQIALTGDMAKHYDIYYRLHVQTFGWLGWAKNGASAGTEGLSKRVEAMEIKLVAKGAQAPGSTDNSFITKPSVTYATHVQTIGWQDAVADGEMSGTSGQSNRLEGIKIDLKNKPYSGSIEYSTHVQSIGWQNAVSNGALSGTSGQSKRLEGIRINLTGDMAKHYDVYYRVHAQTYGWLGWAKNGASAGTEGLAKRLEGIEIVLVNKGAQAPGSTSTSFVKKPSVSYSTHVQGKGWISSVKDGASSGTTGQAKRLEAIKIELNNASFQGDIVYSTHIQGTGWVTNSSNGEISGTVGKSKRLEAIKISLTSDMEKYFDVYYRVHAQNYGWLGWAKNGMKAGSEGLSKRLESIEIKIVPKGTGSAVSAASAFKQAKAVFLDPGHGGSDPGAVAGGYTEANLNLAVAKKVEKLLKSRGYIVYMSRTNDTYVSLLDRSKKANALNPDIFVSIHHNSTGTGSTTVSGMESIFYKYNPAYPSQINSKNHNDPNRIMKSTLLADLLQKNMVGATGANNRGIYGETLAVLRETAVPATLLELGFINNPTERQKLVSSSYQDKTAKAIADGIEEYFKRF
ncbi:N-acetylmuramoyl-L-alanine amidase [Niallia circulans]|uniref:N-acetylmuramoyl-L-alanine amidase n=1 Tax=Niallia circulans TaxID=1397 RepID=UPI00069FCC5F|nr:N-acetylmuramoyl-L-alanine amidase [Niallia circulans]